MQIGFRESSAGLPHFVFIRRETTGFERSMIVIDRKCKYWLTTINKLGNEGQ